MSVFPFLNKHPGPKKSKYAPTQNIAFLNKRTGRLIGNLRYALRTWELDLQL